MRSGKAASANIAPCTPSKDSSEPFHSIMVHNISHSDLVMSLEKSPGQSVGARPKFNEFYQVTKQLYELSDWGVSGTHDHDRIQLSPARYPSTIPHISPATGCSMFWSPMSVRGAQTYVNSPYGWSLASERAPSFSSYNLFKIKGNTFEDRAEGHPRATGTAGLGATPFD